MRAQAQTTGSDLGVDWSTLGSISVDGLEITGTANKVTSNDFYGSGKAQEGYFAGLHFDNAASFSTAKTKSKKLDADGNLLLLLGTDSITCEYIDVTDTKGKTDRFTIDVTAAD